MKLKSVLFLLSLSPLAAGCGLVKVNGVAIGQGSGAQASGGSSGSPAAAASGPKRAVDCPLVGDPGPIVQPTQQETELVQKGTSYFEGNMPNWEMSVARVKKIADYEKVAAEYPVKFKGYWCKYGPEFSGGRTHMERDFLEMKASLERYSAWLKSDEAKAAPGKLDETLAEANKLLEEYRAVPTLRKKEGDALTSSSSDVNVKLNGPAEYYVTVLETAQGAEGVDAKAARAKLVAAKKHVEDVIAEIQEKLTDTYRLAKEEYPGKDKEKVRKTVQALAEQYLNKKAKKVVLLTDWRRDKGSQWVGDKLVTYDQSFVTANVVIAVTDKVAEVWEFVPRTDHIDGDKVKLDVFVPRVVGKMKLANVK